MTTRYAPNPNYQEVERLPGVGVYQQDPDTRYPWKRQDQPFPPAPRLIKRTLYEDPGHAWLEVPHDDIKQFNIAEDISHYSYQDRDYAYLEEDCDLGVYLNAVTKAGYTLEITTIYLSSSARIRNKARYPHHKAYATS